GSHPAALPAAIALLALALAAPARAQSAPPEHPDLQMARQFAPIVWPGTLEQAWPMMPHPLAFDGIDNDGDGLVDLADPDEVGFGLAKSGGALCRHNPAKSWQVSEVLICLARQKQSPRAVVLVDRPASLSVADGTYEALRYWFYYPYDRGSSPHLHDSEH